MRRLAVVLLAAALSGACSAPGPGPSSAPAPSSSAAPAPSSSAAPAPSSAAPRAPDHLVVAIFENKDYAQIAGNSSAPYLNALMERAALLTDSRGITHPSQPNYIALFSGSTHGVTDNRCLTPINAPNLGRQLLDSGRTFVGYSEDLPRPGFTGCLDGRYAAKHNPVVAFANLPPESNQPLTAFPSDFATLPTVAFVVPNLCNDMHDCPISAGDTWARDHLDAYLRWADSHNSVLLVTFDENDGRDGNRILTLFAGAGIRPGRYGDPTDHYRVLRTIQDRYGLAPLGAAAGVAPLSAIWTV